MLRASGVRVLVDHFGVRDIAVGIGHPGFQAVLALGREGIATVKLSSLFRVSTMLAGFDDLDPFVRRAAEGLRRERLHLGIGLAVHQRSQPSDLCGLAARRCRGGCRIQATERACWRTIRADSSALQTRSMAEQPMKPKPLKVALAGAGMISWYHLVGWRNLGERVRLVAVCDPDAARAAKRAEEFSIPHVYRDADAMFAAETIDALDVATPRRDACRLGRCRRGARHRRPVPEAA